MQHFPTEYNIINYRPPLETQPEFSHECAASLGFAVWSEWLLKKAQP